MDPRIAVVRAWHDALNAGDLQRLGELSHEQIEVGGPRGSSQGIALLREWVGRSGIRLEPERIFHANDEVVVEQRATWRSAETGLVGEPQRVASSLRVSEGRLERIVRFPDLRSALASVGLDEASEVR